MMRFKRGAILAISAGWAGAGVARAQELFAPAESFLGEVRDFVLGTPGLIIGALILIVTVIAAVSPRTQIQPIHIVWVIMGLTVIYGAFPIVEAVQGLAAG